MRKPLNLEPARCQPLWEAVYQALRAAIVRGDLAPGERLAEQQLAEEMEASRTPVREALRRLALEGFVVLVPRRGAYVAELSFKDMNDVFELRAALEGLAAALAAERITPEEVAALEQAVRELAEAAAGGASEQVVRIDTDFHGRIYTASRNRRLMQIVANLSDQIQRFRMRSLAAPGRLKDTLSEHRRLVAAIARGDAAQARKLAEEHIERAEASLLKAQQQAAGAGERSGGGGGRGGAGGGGQR
ncbi:GntR family transcriptional regulator [Gelria sp. Kuro-4]|uniref:GntR family transcriptional regulator n=1 Tax=Gelria sp. Kuro-4 TaxID=2796927 RepID=UPI0021072B13|nr:GntR family transcriptional regulator [Gelria sp. Kuro-4]MDK2927718.1 hypothetical protein [Bacillota bacterium]